MFNFLMAMKLDADRKEKHKDKNLKHEYKTNLNVLYGMRVPMLKCGKHIYVAYIKWLTI